MCVCVSFRATSPTLVIWLAWPYMENGSCGVSSFSLSGGFGMIKGGGECVWRKPAGLSGWGFQGVGPTEPAGV